MWLSGQTYCVDDQGSGSSVSTDADCPKGEFCDASIGYRCDSGLSCTSRYCVAGSARRDFFGAMVRSRVARVLEKAVDKSGLNW